MAVGRVPYKNFIWNSDRWDGLELRPDDVIISTAPKCGTTWMQMQIALLLFRTPTLPAPLAKLSPWLEMNTRPLDEVRAELEAQTHRRFIKTHTPLDGLPWDERVTYVHVARDPRDAGMSWDNHVANTDIDRMVELRLTAVGVDDLAELGIDGPPPEPSADPVERFWAWAEADDASDDPSQLEMLLHHSATFWEARQQPNVHLFRYGDQRADLTTEMTRLAAALGVDPPTPDLVDAARFEAMKARSDELVPNSDTSFWRDSGQFFAKARSGDWQHLLDDAGVARYVALVRATMGDDDLVTWLHGGPLV
jgi:aryl sulfotransferase